MRVANTQEGRRLVEVCAQSQRIVMLNIAQEEELG